MERIAAVVVTYNRKALLVQCLEHLLNQSIPCDILIVDNASTDGTATAVGELLQMEPRLHYQNTGRNSGGAGGFNYGMHWAVQAGYEYLWLMDDDTLPHPAALEKLFEADIALKGEYGWLSSRCLWTDGSLCPMNLQRITPYRDLKEFRLGLEPVQMASFVSLFLKTEIVKHVGLPIRDFFIWADDWEYSRRISRVYPCYAVKESNVVHAMKTKSIVNIATDVPERLMRYRYFYRNDVYLYRREGIKGWLWLFAKDCWHSLQVLQKSKKYKCRKLAIIWGGFFCGITFSPKAN